MLYSLISAGLYQLHDKDKGVAAYASKTLLPLVHPDNSTYALNHRNAHK